jgi:FMN reductase
MSASPLIVGIGGTTRDGSTSEQALKAALAHAASLGCETLIFPGTQLPTEIYDPSLQHRSANAVALVRALCRADGVLIATPAYHGGLSGLVKNALDFTEDLRADERAYLQDRAVGCIVCAEGAQAMGSTLASLRAIVHALRGWPTPYGATLNSNGKPFGSAGQAADAAAVQACQTVAEQVVGFARMHLGLS